MLELLRYQREDGGEPFSAWLNTLRDKSSQARIRVRLRQLEMGNFGDSQPVGAGVIELRIHGAGYRVYCGRHGKAVVLLLCGGDKGSQAGDIRSPRRCGRNGNGGRHEQAQGAVSHHAAEVAELRADRQLAVEYLKAALESLDDPTTGPRACSPCAP